MVSIEPFFRLGSKTFIITLISMRAKLTYLFLPALAVCMMPSCVSDDPEVAPSGAEMKFAPGNVSRSTDASNIKDNPFVVFCDRKREEDQLPLVLMNNVPVTYNSTTGGWEYSNPQFWFPDNEHSFVAIHPASVVYVPDADVRYVSSQLTFTYTLPSDYRQTADILAATHRRRYTSGSADEVYFRFAHMLTRINVTPALNDNIMGSDGYIEFYKLELSGIKTKAAFKITPTTLLTADQTDDRDVDVAGQDAEGSLTIEFTEPKRVTNNREYVSLFDDKDAVIVAPQSFAADSEAKITLYYTINNDPEMKQITLLLAGQKWTLGKSYTYRFTVDRTGAHFDTTTITDWDVMNAGNIEVH